MAASMTVSGLDDCLRFFDQAPSNLMKVSRKATKSAARTTAKYIRKQIPERWRKLVRTAVDKEQYSGKLRAYVGLFQTGASGGHQNPHGGEIPDWFKAYWLNYGTLGKRDPEHHFKAPIKHRGTAAAKRRRNNVGVAPRHFFEQAIPGWTDVFVEAFQDSLKKQEKELYDR